MASRIKTGPITYFSRGLLIKKWKEAWFELYDDSTIVWFEKSSSKRPLGCIYLSDVCQYLSVGPYTRCVPGRPSLPKHADENDENMLICVPKDLKKKKKEILWILCHDMNQLNEWMKAIVSTLPPPPAPSSHNKPNQTDYQESDRRRHRDVNQHRHEQQTNRTLVVNSGEPCSDRRDHHQRTEQPIVSNQKYSGADIALATIAGAAIGGSLGWAWGMSRSNSGYGMGYGWGPMNNPYHFGGGWRGGYGPSYHDYPSQVNYFNVTSNNMRRNDNNTMNIDDNRDYEDSYYAESHQERDRIGIGRRSLLHHDDMFMSDDEEERRRYENDHKEEVDNKRSDVEASGDETDDQQQNGDKIDSGNEYNLSDGELKDPEYLDDYGNGEFNQENEYDNEDVLKKDDYGNGDYEYEQEDNDYRGYEDNNNEYGGGFGASDDMGFGSNNDYGNNNDSYNDYGGGYGGASGYDDNTY